MPVLLRPMFISAAGGVRFGADPVEGRTDRILVSPVRSGPTSSSSGSAQGVRYQVIRYARVVRDDFAGHDGPLSRRRTT